MKKINCEMCGSSDLLKVEGIYVCQSCGCKYTVEEARKLMIEGTVQIEGTVKVDNSDSIQNYLDIAKNALNSGNGEDAEKYANKVLEITPKNTDAWLIKMQAIGYLGTIGNPRLPEIISCGENAIQYADFDHKTKVEFRVYDYYLERSLELLKIVTQQLTDTEHIKSVFKTFALINVFSAGSEALKADSEFVNIISGLAENTVDFSLKIPEENIKNSKELQRLLKEVAKQYNFVTKALVDRYEVYGANLLDSTINYRNERVKSLRINILTDEELNRQIENKKESLIKEFFESHPEEYEEINKLKDSIKPDEEKILTLNQNIENLNLKIRELDEIKKEYNKNVSDNLQAIKKNEHKLFGKDTAKASVDEAKRQVDLFTSKVEEINRQVEDISTLISKKEQEKNQIASEVEPVNKKIADFYEEKIFKGFGM